jgi:hypothetical protein
MKRLLLILILTLSFQSWTKADDIRDFQIEGMSIGDSALDFFSKSELNNAHEIKDYKNKKYRYYFLSFDKSQTYEYIQITVKPSDRKFIIQAIDGHIFFYNNINDCYKKMSNIKKEVDNVFNTIGKDDSGAHPGYSNSTYKRVFYRFENGAAELACYDMSKKSKKTDRLGFSIKNLEFLDFVTNEAY